MSAAAAAVVLLVVLLTIRTGHPVQISQEYPVSLPDLEQGREMPAVVPQTLPDRSTVVNGRGIVGPGMVTETASSHASSPLPSPVRQEVTAGPEAGEEIGLGELPEV